MITFNELRISEDGKCLIIDAEITNLDIYSDMYIKSISIDYYQNAGSSIPSTKAYSVYSNTADDSSVKAKRVVVPQSTLPLTEFGINSFKDGLFYVIVTCDGDLPASIVNFACGYDDTVKIGVALDWKSFYERGMRYAAQIASNCGKVCEENSGFEDFIMQWNALKLAINTCSWHVVGEVWDKIQRTDFFGAPVVFGGCGCGR